MERKIQPRLYHQESMTRVVKKFILIMTGISTFLSYAKGQEIPLSPMEGIIMYNDSLGIPQEVIFIPITLKKGRRLKGLIRKTLSDQSTFAYVVYFQGVRWVLPDLESTVANLNTNQIIYGHAKVSAKISYGRLTFNTSVRADPDVGIDETIHDVPIVFNNRSYKLKVTELPDRFGAMVLFEKVEFVF